MPTVLVFILKGSFSEKFLSCRDGPETSLKTRQVEKKDQKTIYIIFSIISTVKCAVLWDSLLVFVFCHLSVLG